MVIRLEVRQGGWLGVELLVALGILALGILPLGYSFLHEAKLCRAYYYRAVAMEVVDGELEVLAAGGYQRLANGTNDYVVVSPAANGLPGRFVSVLADGLLRLEWRPLGSGLGGDVSREVRLR